MMNRRIVVFCVLSLFLTSCAHKDMELPEIVQVKKVTPYHKVSDGETVGAIAEQYKMTRADLIKLNNLEPPYQLYNGQKLIVNVRPEDVESSNTTEQVSVSQPTEPEPIPDSAQNLNSTILEYQRANNAENNQVESKTEDVAESQDDESTIDDIASPQESAKQAAVTYEYIWPIENGKSKVTQHFNSSEVDGGIIIDASVGTPVKAIADGNVVIAGTPSGEAAAYGTTVVIKHAAKKTMSIYANLKEANVTVGKKVKQGDIIGKVGKTGSIAQKPQLYFELNDLKGGSRKAVDPESYFPR